MIEIQVRVNQPTSPGRLFTRYDEESRILVAESAVRRSAPFGVDVDGGMVFDLDAARVLINVDLHIAREYWKRKTIRELPLVRVKGDLEFTVSTIKHKSFHLPLNISCDESMRDIYIELGRLQPDRAVVLSDNCFALLSGDMLSGFFLQLV